MRIKNNSKREWMNYNCGGGNFVDIKAGATIKVKDHVGRFLLGVLGDSKWLVEVKKEEVEAEIEVKKEEVEVKQPTRQEMKDYLKEYLKENKVEFKGNAKNEVLKQLVQEHECKSNNRKNS